MALSLAVLLFSAAPAQAGTASDRPLLFTFDGSDTTAGAFTGPNALDIDQASGTVYVIDQGHGVLDKFNAAGAAQSFSATGGSSLSTGIGINGLPDVAIDNSSANPGRIHVIKEFGPVKAFSPAGTQLWEFGGFADACGLAVDAAGHPWIGDYSNKKAREYSTTGSPPAEIGSVSMSGGDRPCRLDVDASGNVYVNRYFGGVDKYEGGVKVATVDPNTSFGVTVDQSGATGHVFTLHGQDFNEYNSTGTLLGTFGSVVIGDGRGIAYDAALDRVYVSDGGSNSVEVFGPAATGTVPDVSVEPTTEIGISKAKFSGKVNPQSIPNSYHFEWKKGTVSSWGGAKSSAPQSLPEDSVEHAVSFNATGLAGNTTYQVRLVGVNTENNLRAASSADTFTTDQAAVAPTVTIESPTAVTGTTAMVHGTVNPHEDAGTTYRFQISTDPACASGFSGPSSRNLGSEANAPVPVAEEFTGLISNQHYCVRFSATNSFGTTNSEVKEFTTEQIPPDQVFTAFAAPRTDTTARINGRVNPEGSTPTLPLTYRFEYSKDGGSTWIALPDQEYSGGARKQIVVSAELTNLSPSTTYSYRFSAESGAGPASPQGEVKTFTTRSSAEIVAPQRGIELVNIPDKGNQNLFSSWDPSPLTGDGNTALWYVNGGLPAATASSGSVFLSERDPGGWASHNLIPAPDQQIGGGDFAYAGTKATPDFEHFVFAVGRNGPLGLQGNTLVLLDRHQHQKVLASFEGLADSERSEISDDGGHVLTINPDNRQLEDLGGSTPEVISIMPDGNPSECGLSVQGESFVGTGPNNTANNGAVPSWSGGIRMSTAKDASRVYFQARPDGSCGGAYALYERNRGAEETTLIDSGSDVHFIRATPDGRQAYFSTASQLDPADENTGSDVYRWDEASGGASCLTCVVANAKVEPQQGFKISDDFSHVYFHSSAQLVPGYGTAGERSLYVLSDGEIRFIGGLEAWLGSGSLSVESTLSHDGNVLTFRSNHSGDAGLTTDRLPENCKEAPVHLAAPSTCREIYRYDDRDASMECLSCNRAGETVWQAGSSYVNPDGDFRMSGDGRTVAFITLESLLPEDVNQAADVYEWRGGTIHLVSDGVTAFQEGFSGPQVRAVSDDGSSILFIIDQPGLTGFEQDGLNNLYVARTGGGFVPPPPPTPCDGDACQGPLQGPGAAPPAASSSFSGHGNVKEGQGKPRCAKNKVRRRGRCVRKRNRHNHKRASNANQGRTK